MDKAAKVARVRAHPDRKIKADMTEGEKHAINKEAARVGQAADILTDPIKVNNGDLLLARRDGC